MSSEDKIVAGIERKIKTGDVVLHRPSGETWLVAYAENGYVCPCGWPETIAKESDCELVDSASEENRIRLLHEIANKQGNDTRRAYARRVLGLSAAMLVLCLIQLAAAPLLPPLEQPVLVEIGAPPCCPENPHLQYWHTMDVPTDAGVFPVQVFAPRLVAQMASEPGLVETPEPGQRAPLGIGLGCLVGYVYFTRKAQRKAQRYRAALNEIYWNSGDDAAKQIARKALEE